jgi:hypothetical protein
MIMSEERRKRQEQRDGGGSNDGKTKKTLLYGVIVILLVGAFIAFRYHENHKYDSFAKCLAAKQTKMYGLSWCSHCADQKEMFGDAFHYVPYVECGDIATKDETPECKAAGLKLFPSWQFGVEPPREGLLSLEALSDKTGCSLP